MPSEAKLDARTFRLGESPLWGSLTFSGQAVSGAVFPFPRLLEGQSKNVHAVSWEIYTEDKQDLLDLMWTGELCWEFGLDGDQIPIGPLSMYHGSFFDMLFSQGAMSDLEELAGVKAEDEWRGMCQTFLVGKTHFFRGLQRYTQHPILLPPGASWRVKVKFTEPFKPRGLARMRVILNGIWRSPVEVR